MNEARQQGRPQGRRLWAAAAAATLVLWLGPTLQAATEFTFLGALSSVLTPNGDGRNDVAFLCFDNPRASEVSGAIFDLRGNKVASMALVASGAFCPGAPLLGGKLTWDGRQSGQAVASGIYFYQVRSEDTVITGALMVVR